MSNKDILDAAEWMANNPCKVAGLALLFNLLFYAAVIIIAGVGILFAGNALGLI